MQNLQGNILTSPDLHILKGVLDTNCLLYLPPDRFEEPAWLNQENLTAQARIRKRDRMLGRTNREIICYAPLQVNLDWLYDVVYDRAVFEIEHEYTNVRRGKDQIVLVPVVKYSGSATTIYDALLQLIRLVTDRSDSRFGIGQRGNRVVSIESASGQLVPNIFQMSSGEVSLLNIGISILRDFDWCDAAYGGLADVRGIVLIDEVELHLHAFQQYEILPRLLQMFPNVQFIVTSHSPLFVLGMRQTFAESGFELHELPDGHPITAEEFSEFYNAYAAFTTTKAFTQDIRKSIEQTQRPMLVVEGSTDQRYIQRAAQLLCKQSLLQEIDIIPGNGSSNLSKIWNGFTQHTLGILSHAVLLLHDCDKRQQPQAKGRLHKRSIPMQQDHLIGEGIENLFGRSVLDNALKHKSAFLDIEEEHTKTVRGLKQPVPEKWSVNNDEKSNLCEWICANGTAEDFDRFIVVFELLEEVFASRD